MQQDVRAVAFPQRIDPMQRVAIGFIGAAFAWNNDVLPLRYENGTLTVAIPPGKIDNNIANADLMAAISKEARGLDKAKIAVRAQPIDQIRERLKILYPRQAAASSDTARLFERIVEEAANRGASDVYIQAYEEHGEVRLNIDNNVLPSRVAESISLEIHDRLIGILKNRGEVQPQNLNLPGDGRLSVVTDGRMLDIRIATLPLGRGHERASVRFLNLSPTVRTLDSLGISPSQYQYLTREISQPEFFIVIAGPVGAGKSTLAYAILLSIDRAHKNVISLENPIEQHLDNVCQVPIDIDENQANERAQMTFAMAARSLVRHNPDIEFLGEIRDAETMREGIRAANTGVSLLSTLHCRSALHVVNRMQILEARSREIADSVTMATSQRLLNRLCPACKIESSEIGDDTKQIADFFEINLNSQIYAPRPDGCPACYNTGQSGRIGAFEFLKFSMPIREIISKEATVQDLAVLAFQEGYRPMAVNAIEHLSTGIVAESAIRSRVSYEELLHVINAAKSNGRPSQDSSIVRRTTLSLAHSD